MPFVDYYPQLPQVKLTQAQDAIATIKARILLTDDERKALNSIDAKLAESLAAKENRKALLANY